ncbi:MAG: response regulator [Planctomycetota bacterium]
MGVALVVLGVVLVAALILLFVQHRRLVRATRSVPIRELANQRTLEATASLAHDLNNVLLVSTGRLAELERDDGHNLEEHCLALGHALERATTLCHRALDRSSTLTTDFEPLDLEQLARDCRSSLPTEARERIDVVRESEDALEVKVDRTEAERALLNLLLNALESSEPTTQLTVKIGHTAPGALPEGGVWSRTLDRSQHHVHLSVVDRGVGISEPELQRIFDPHFTTRAGGRGLGLWSCRQLVELAFGAIHVHSVVGEGSAFSMFLPRSPAAIEQAQTDDPIRRQVSDRGAVLVVDDEPEVANTVARALAAQGFAARTVNDGEEAIADVKANRVTEIVFLDVSMPDLDGYQTLDRMRRERPDLSIVLMSGHDEDTVRRRLEDRSFDAFLRKPFDGLDLSAVMVELRARRNDEN